MASRHSHAPRRGVLRGRDASAGASLAACVRCRSSDVARRRGLAQRSRSSYRTRSPRSPRPGFDTVFASRRRSCASERPRSSICRNRPRAPRRAKKSPARFSTSSRFPLPRRPRFAAVFVMRWVVFFFVAAMPPRHTRRRPREDVAGVRPLDAPASTLEARTARRRAPSLIVSARSLRPRTTRAPATAASIRSRPRTRRICASPGRSRPASSADTRRRRSSRATRCSS